MGSAHTFLLASRPRHGVGITFKEFQLKQSVKTQALEFLYLESEKNPMTRIPKSQKIHGFFILRLQVEQQIANLCFRSINDPVELGLTGGGGPWAHWVQLVITMGFIRKSFRNIWVDEKQRHNLTGICHPVALTFPGSRQHDPSCRTDFGIQSSLNVWGLQLSRNQDFYGKMLSLCLPKHPFHCRVLSGMIKITLV